MQFRNWLQSDASKRVKRVPTGDYEVGFCKPPREHQLKHGNNANPRGRKKGTRNHKVVIQEVLFESVTVREAGEIKQMSMLEAIIKKTASKALAGDNKAALAIIGMAHREGLLTPELEEAVENLSENDKAIMDDIYNRTPVPQTAPQAQAPEPERPKSDPKG